MPQNIGYDIRKPAVRKAFLKRKESSVSSRKKRKKMKKLAAAFA